MPVPHLFNEKRFKWIKDLRNDDVQRLYHFVSLPIKDPHCFIFYFILIKVMHQNLAFEI